MSAPWQDEWVRMTLRLPRQLHQKLQFLSSNAASLNAEIVNRLEWACAEPPSETEELDAAAVATIHDKLDQILVKLGPQMSTANRLQFVDAAGNVVADPDVAWDIQK